MADNELNNGDEFIGLMFGGVDGKRYEILDRRGKGGMASVFHAKDKDLGGKDVAIKILHREFQDRPDIVDRFIREAKSLASVKTKYIVDVTDCGACLLPNKQTMVYMVMELLDGHPMHEEMEKHGGYLPQAGGGRYILQVLTGLSYAHDKGIVHRDIKPENLMLVRNEDTGNYDQVKIFDFGIAKLMPGSSNVDEKMTQTGLPMGTAQYMSPEQAESRPDIDWRTDIYAVGTVLYEMLSGCTPFDGDSYFSILHKHVYDPVPPLTVRGLPVPERLEHVVMRALEKNPSSRYQRASEMRRDLEPFLPAISSTDHALSQTLLAASLPPSVGTQGARETPPAPRPRMTNRQRLLLAILATFALASVIALVAFLRPSARAPHASLPNLATTLPQTLITPPVLPPPPVTTPIESDAGQVAPTVVVAVPPVPPPPIRHVPIRRPPVHPRCGPEVYDNYGNRIPCL